MKNATLGGILVLLLLGCGPIGPIAGGRLSGDVHTSPAANWSEVGAIETIQLETNPADPYSINAWCGVYAGALYIPTSLILGADEPTEREWVQNVLTDSRVRLRADGNVYELKAVRVEDPKELEAARAALLAKYEIEVDDHVKASWLFRLEAR
ncbi:MAG: hypothetical protein GY725_23885 [bacterium]|nr:hypothetical protein [bacterium]